MIKIQDVANCCGCGACMNICPAKCIAMTADTEGFLYPVADAGKCVDCALCEKVCPIINYRKTAPNVPPAAAAVQHKDREVLRQSTAGGAFTAIAEYVIDQGGVVFGVELAKDSSVRHCMADRKPDLSKFRNSKYVQSDTGTTFQNVKHCLKAGRMVCYSGTPCQIEGLLRYLQDDYEREKLILVDVVCRAVPSPGVWRKYIGYIEKKYGEIKSVRFRDKTLGYQYSTMEIVTESGKTLREGIESGKWLRMFFSGMIIRPSCAACLFRGIDRKSDFTIWDCLNAYHVDRRLDETQGVTRVLIHTEKGKKIFEQISGSFEYDYVSVETAVKNVREFERSPVIDSRRSDFYSDLSIMSFEGVLKKYFPDTVTVKAKTLARRALNLAGLDVWLKHYLRKG